MIAYAAAARLFGSFRTKVRFDFIKREYHAFSMLRMADMARAMGLEAITVIEFGVAAGAGLRSICRIAEMVERETGVRIQIVGFDTGTGLPPPSDYRDHPERFQAGDHIMVDPDALLEALPTNAQIRFGDVADEVHGFLDSVDPACPIGCVFVDLDYYSSATAALRVFSGGPLQYLPMTCVYFDSTLAIDYTEFAGERLAITEFNEANPLRKIDRFWSVKNERVYKSVEWLDAMYVLHIFDHPLREFGESAYPLNDRTEFRRQIT